MAVCTLSLRRCIVHLQVQGIPAVSSPTPRMQPTRRRSSVLWQVLPAHGGRTGYAPSSPCNFNSNVRCIQKQRTPSSSSILGAR